MNDWKEIDDNKINHVWKCTEPGCEEKAHISPDWYEQNGTPVCPECDCDMVYDKTLIKA